MSPVKLVHVIKHLEMINRDISELRHLEEVLTNDRTYSNNIRISLELQINSLLNERVKLMELKIQDPPPTLQKIKASQELYSQKKKPFSFHAHEQDYLPKLLGQSSSPEGDSMADSRSDRRDYAPKITQKIFESEEKNYKPSLLEKESHTISPSRANSNVGSLISKKPFSASTQEDNQSIKKDIKGFLKNLPTLDY